MTTLTRDDFYKHEMALRKEMFHVEFPPNQLPVWRYGELDGCILYKLDRSDWLDARYKKAGAVIKLVLTRRRDEGVRWGYRSYAWDDYDIYIWPNLQYDGCPERYRPTLEAWLRFVRDTYSERASKARTTARCASIKEELMMNRWHPKRVAAALEAGIEVEDL